MKVVSTLSIILLTFTFLHISGCSGDPNKKANKLYTEASQALQLSKKENKNYSDLLDSYKSAKNRIDRILSEYPSSNIAVELSSDGIKVSGLTLSQFRELELSLKVLAEAEQSPLSCALLVAKTIEEAWEKS